MTLDPAHLEHARKVANAVLYEGYLLYPYRRSAQKNQARFQFGVLMPPAYLAADDSERSACQTECLAECADDARVEICVRYLQLRRRAVQAATPEGGLVDTDRLRLDGAEYTPWDEAAECEQWFTLPVADLLGARTQRSFGSPCGAEVQKLADPQGGVAGRLIWRWSQLNGVLAARAERVAGPYRALRLRVRVENRTQPPARPPRPAACPPARPDLRAHPDRDRQRDVPVDDRPPGVGGLGGSRLHPGRHLARAHRAARLPEPDALRAGHPA